MLIIKNALLIDPSSTKEPSLKDVWINDGIIVAPLTNIPDNAQIIQASGKWLTPGFIDLNCRFKDNGLPNLEEIRDAQAGGFTALCPSPDTEPAIDNITILEYLKSCSRGIEILPLVALSKELKGQELVDMASLKVAGGIAFTDKPFESLYLLSMAFQYTANLNVTIISHPRLPSLDQAGVMNYGSQSLKLGLRGLLPESECIAIASQIELLRKTPQARLHFTQISTARSVELIRRAKNDGLRVTAAVTPYHLAFTENDLKDYDTNLKTDLPLRTASDQEALKVGLADGTLDALTTNHTYVKKQALFAEASFGMIGFESAFSVFLKQLITLKPTQLISLLTMGPTKCLNLNLQSPFKVGSKANLTIIDPETEWIFDKKQEAKNEDNYSPETYNSPFIGQKLRGRILCTICAGKIVYSILP
jgi:dihydroorotase